MYCQAGFDQWLRTMSTHFPHVGKPHATVLTMGSLGLALARPCALSAVSALLDEDVQPQENKGYKGYKASEHDPDML